MFGVIIRAAAYIILIFTNIKSFKDKKKLHNIGFAIFFATLLVQVTILDRYLSENIIGVIEVFQFVILLISSFLFLRDRSRENKIRE